MVRSNIDTEVTNNVRRCSCPDIAYSSVQVVVPFTFMVFGRVLQGGQWLPATLNIYSKEMRKTIRRVAEKNETK
jgi:hypothetical protein